MHDKLVTNPNNQNLQYFCAETPGQRGWCTQKPGAGQNREDVMGFSQRPLSSLSRRQVLKSAAAGAVTSIVGASRSDAAAKGLTLIHESSFIKNFDAYFQNTLAPAYEKLTGVKISYELASVGS